MAQAFPAAVEPSNPTPAVEDITIRVNVDFDDSVTVSVPYVNVPENSSRIITWSLETELEDEVFFDTPAVTMFGEDPDVDWHIRSGNVQKLTWYNMNPAKSHHSFFYRLHLIKKTIVGGVVCYTPLATDPMVRNDPPPAP